jgi:DNA-binding NarL/FixJ family response regulator
MLRIACEQEGFRVVGEAWSGREGIELCLELDPDVLVLDLALPHVHGFDVIRHLKVKGQRARILVLTGSDGRNALIRALELGADGFVEKTSDADHIVAAIREVAAGRSGFGNDMLRRAGADLVQIAQRARVAAAYGGLLTPRELETLRLVADGLTNSQIATRMGIAQSTVNGHVASVYGKLEVQSRVQAVQKASELGLFDSTPAGRTGLTAAQPN